MRDVLTHEDENITKHLGNFHILFRMNLIHLVKHNQSNVLQYLCLDSNLNT